MVDIPLGADVECADGPYGKSVTVVIDPTGPKVTHLVVQARDLTSPEERLVPVEHVVETTSERIRLSCTKDQVAQMDPFVETRYVADEWAAPGYWYSYDDVYLAPYAAPLEPFPTYELVELTPEGQVALNRGTWVEATDGYVGKVAELVVDPASGNITHFVLQEGHLWGKKEITLPLSAIDRFEPDTIYLTLDKKAVEQLPALPLSRRYQREAAHGANLELVAKVFDNPTKAGEALDFVEDLHRRKTLKILNAAILVKEVDGTTSLKDTRDIDPKRGRLLGAITGGLVGLLAGPVGAALGAVAGAGAGGAAGRWIDMGFSDKFLTGLQERMEPGTSALIVLVEHEWSGSFHEALSETEGIIFQQELTDALVEQLVQEGEAE